MPLIVIAVAVLLILGAGFLLWKYPTFFGLGMMALAMFATVLDVATSGLQLGITLYPLDFGCAALVASCAVVTLRTYRSPNDLCWPSVILLALGLLNFFRGAALFGIKSPGNSARQLIYLILPVVAFSYLGPALRMTVEGMIKALSLVSLVLAAVAAARWAGILPMPEDLISDDFREVVRALPSDYVIVIAQGLIGIIGLQLMQGFRTIGIILTVLFAGLVLALQHRSVWTATIAGLIWLLVRAPRVNHREWLKVTSLVLLVVAALTLIPIVASGTLDRIEQLVHSNIEEVNHDDSTWAWRLAGYTEAIQRSFSNGVLDAALGPPSGEDLSNTASFASIVIHDRYIYMLAYYGVTGLLALLVLLAATGIRIYKFKIVSPRDREAKAAKVILEALLVSVIVYFIPYAGGEFEGLLLGALWLASTGGIIRSVPSLAPHAGSVANTRCLRAHQPDWVGSLARLHLSSQPSQHDSGREGVNV